MGRAEPVDRRLAAFGDTESFWRSLDMSACDKASPAQAGTRGALYGMRVVDLSRVLAGPLCAQILGDLGAQVVKVEAPQGDETRRLGKAGAEGSAPYFMGLNRNKCGIVLDLEDAEDRAVLHALIASADVVIENFRQGTMERWGLSYEEVLAPQYPGLIYLNISGFGSTGPLAGLPGYDAVAQALAGLMSINGHAATGATRVGVPVCDISTGLFAAIALLAAWSYRHQSGCGQRIDANLYASGLSLLHPHAANFWMQDLRPGLTGNAHPSIAPYETFVVRGEAMFIGVVNDGQFAKLCQYLQLDALTDDPRFQRAADRVVHRAALHEMLREAFERCWHPDLWRALMGAGVPAGMVRSVEEALMSEQTSALGLVPDRGFFGVPFPVRLSRTPATQRMRAPALQAASAETPRQSP